MFGKMILAMGCFLAVAAVGTVNKIQRVLLNSEANVVEQKLADFSNNCGLSCTHT